LDLWYQGKNILTDAGTFSYFPGISRLHETQAHNCVWVDGRSQMKHYGAFIWIKWTKARLVQFAETPEQIFWQGEITDYCNIKYSRKVILKRRLCIIVDDIIGEFNSAEINWNINAPLKPDVDRWKLIIGNQVFYIFTDYPVKLNHCQISRYYGYKEKIIQLRGQQFPQAGKVTFMTLLIWDHRLASLDIAKLRSEALKI